MSPQIHRLAQSTCHFTALHSQIRVARGNAVTGYEPGEVIIGTYVYRVQKKASCALLCHTPMI